MPSNGGSADSIWVDSANLRRSRLANRRLREAIMKTSSSPRFCCLCHCTNRFTTFTHFAGQQMIWPMSCLSDQESLSALASMENDLRKSVSPVSSEERPERDLFIALSDTMRRFKIEKQPFLDLLTAFRMDQIKKAYQSQRSCLSTVSCPLTPLGEFYCI